MIPLLTYKRQEHRYERYDLYGPEDDVFLEKEEEKEQVEEEK